MNLNYLQATLDVKCKLISIWRQFIVIFRGEYLRYDRSKAYFSIFSRSAY